MKESQFSSPQQPDVTPKRISVSDPSLWVYIILISVASVMIAFSFREKTDWAGLMLNLATELFGAVIILILVERKLRENEVNAILELPKRVGTLFSLLRSSYERQYYKYAQSFLYGLEKNLEKATPRPKLNYLKPKLEQGFLLIGNAGEGKSSWLQFSAKELIIKYLDVPTNNKLPVLFPLRNWAHSMSLEEGIYEHVNSFSPISKKFYERALRQGKILVILDGVDHIYVDDDVSFLSELSILMGKYQNVSFTVSSRPSSVSNIEGLESVELPPLTEQEIAEIAEIESRLRSR